MFSINYNIPGAGCNAINIVTNLAINFNVF